jgi:membrane protein YqaA with SNARE-associated domain
VVEQYGLQGLFAAAFLAATILPLQSEALLVALLAAGGHPAWALLAVASLGNTLGSVANWALGRFLIRFRDRRWFPVKEAAYERARRAFLRWGLWSLLFAWLPFVGDPLTVVAGALKVRLPVFVLLVGFGKTARYAALIAAAAPLAG